MPPRPILMDLDGTLVDSLPDLAESANHVRRVLGRPVLQEAEIRSMIGGGVRVLMERVLSVDGGVPPDPKELDDALALYRDHHLLQCTRLVRPYPGVLNRLATWRREGHPMAVVTNKPEEYARRVLSATGLDRIPVLVGGDTASDRKPSPLPLRLALDALADMASGASGWGDHPPAGTVMIGDGHHDIRAGKALSIQTVGVLYGYQQPEEVRMERPDRVWSSFEGDLPPMGKAEDPNGSAAAAQGTQAATRGIQHPNGPETPQREVPGS